MKAFWIVEMWSGTAYRFTQLEKLKNQEKHLHLKVKYHWLGQAGKSYSVLKLPWWLQNPTLSCLTLLEPNWRLQQKLNKNVSAFKGPLTTLAFCTDLENFENHKIFLSHEVKNLTVVTCLAYLISSPSKSAWNFSSIPVTLNCGF